MNNHTARLLALSIALFCSTALASAQWSFAMTDSTASLRGIHNTGGGVIWASGAAGTILRSEDEGYMWQTCSVPPDAAKLDFRAIFGWDANHAEVMASGPGVASRLYETTDGCATWHLLFENPDRDGFWDALTFHGNTGFILGDPVGGRFVLYRSDDLGRHWHRENSPALAAAAAGEGVFAASNSSLVVLSNFQLLFATGGIGGPRVFRVNSSGEWNATKVPMAGGRAERRYFLDRVPRLHPGSRGGWRLCEPRADRRHRGLDLRWRRYMAPGHNLSIRLSFQRRLGPETSSLDCCRSERQ